MEKQLVTYDDKTLAIIKGSVAKGATTEEFNYFISLCKSTGLNPFKKEIWFIKTSQGVQIMTGINGFYAIANSHPQFDGLEVETVEEAGQLVKAVARCYRKDRSRPMVAEAYLSEYGKNYGNWKTMPRLMLAKCAESMALRKSFAQELNGLYSSEEMPAEYSQKLEVTTPAPAPERFWYYDIGKMPKDKLSDAIDYLGKNDATLNTDFDCYQSSKELKKLSRYEVKGAELKERTVQYIETETEEMFEESAA